MPKEVAMSTRKGHALPFSTAAALGQFSLFLSPAFLSHSSAQRSRNFAAFSIFLSFLFGLPIGFIHLSIIYAKNLWITA